MRVFAGMLVGFVLAMVSSSGMRGDEVKKEEAVRILASGGVGDVKLRPQFSPYILLSQPTYEKMMASWHPGGVAPKVDWASEFVIVGTTVGSKITTVWEVKNEDLSISYKTTADAQEGFRYEMVVVKRALVKSVSGIPIGKKE